MTNLEIREFAIWPTSETETPRSSKWVPLADYEVVAGNLRLAEEGLANATQENQSLITQRDHWLEIAREKDAEIERLKATYPFYPGTVRSAESGETREPCPGHITRADGTKVWCGSGKGHPRACCCVEIRPEPVEPKGEPAHWADMRKFCTCPKPGTSSSTIDPTCPIGFPHPWQRPSR